MAKGAVAADYERDRLDQDRRIRELELAQEKEIKERELLLQEQEIGLKREQQKIDYGNQRWTRWGNPGIVAILAGLIAYLSTVYSGCMTSKLEAEKSLNTLALEDRRLRGNLILEAIKTGSSVQELDRFAANLVLLHKAGIITLSPELLQEYEPKAKKVNPGLPVKLANVSANDVATFHDLPYRAVVIHATTILSPLNGPRVKLALGTFVTVHAISGAWAVVDDGVEIGSVPTSDIQVSDETAPAPIRGNSK